MSRYEERKAAGLCPVCGGKRADEGRIICEGCREYFRRSERITRDGFTPEERFAFNERKRKATNARNARMREQGLCVSCGKASPDRWLCDKCAEKRRDKKNENA